MTQITYTDLELPRASIMRIIKNASDGKMVQKDVKLALAKASTVFISYLTAAAHDESVKGGQRTIAASHVLKALEAVGFGEWLPRLQEQLAAHQASLVASKGKAGEQVDDRKLDSTADIEVEEDMLPAGIVPLEEPSEPDEENLKRARIENDATRVGANSAVPEPYQDSLAIEPDVDIDS